MIGSCPCGRESLKLRRSHLGWALPEHVPDDPAFADPYRTMNGRRKCLKSGSLRFRHDGSQTMLGGVHNMVNGEAAYVRSHVIGDHGGFAQDPEMGWYVAVPITEGVPCRPSSS